MTLEPCCSLLHSPRERYQDGDSIGLCDWLAETLEIGIGTLCGFITWQFTVQSEEEATNADFDNLHQQPVAKRPLSDLVLHPSPGLMLLSCLVFGCCVSSFVHRRQDQDSLQFLVYTIVLGATAIAGCGLGASANMIVLGYLPWAMCVAMAVSFVGHIAFRRRRTSVGRHPYDHEKEQLLG